MPDIAQHHVFGQDVRASLPAEIRSFLLDTPYVFALFGPDPWFVYRIWKRRSGRGRRMHTTKTGDFLAALALRARDGSARQEMFSYLAGFLCHYALDSTAHPYIVWQTTVTWPTKKAHLDLEHALDVNLMKREGFWGEKHPLTDHHFPKLQLPERMAEDLDGVYQSVYGWTNALRDVNRCYLLYRWLFRQMEKPRSPLTVLATLIPTHRLRAFPLAKSAFLDKDVENLSHTPWHEAYARELTSTESYPELYEKARAEAVRMITDAWAFIRGTMTEAELRKSIGSRSYLSGLDVNDPRNLAVRSLRPPAG